MDEHECLCGAVWHERAHQRTVEETRQGRLAQTLADTTMRQAVARPLTKAAIPRDTSPPPLDRGQRTTVGRSVRFPSHFSLPLFFLCGRAFACLPLTEVRRESLSSSEDNATQRRITHHGQPSCRQRALCLEQVRGHYLLLLQDHGININISFMHH